MTAKQAVQEVLSRLPDDCTLDEIQCSLEQLELKSKIEEGLAAIERGEYYTHEEVCAMMEQWLAE